MARWLALLLTGCSFSGPSGAVDGGEPDASVDLGPGDVATVLGSCLAYRQAGFNQSGVYPIEAGGRSFDAHCDMETDGGGWTLALKIDGSADTFEYGNQSSIWLDDTLVAETSGDADREEAKLASYLVVGFDAILVRFDSDTLGGSWPRQATMSLDAPVTSLLSLMTADSPPSMTADVDSWRAMVEGIALQPNCERAGVNQENGFFHRVRIGVDFNNENDCNTNDSGVGVGFESTEVNAPAAGAQHAVDRDVMEVFGAVYVR